MTKFLVKTLFLTHKFKYPIYLGGFLYESFPLAYDYTCMASFLIRVLRHNMHHVDFSVSQSGLPGSCACPYVPDCSARRWGSTSVIVTTGSSKLVPQTGSSQKLALLLFSIMAGTQRNSWVQKIYCTSPIVTMSNRRKVSVGVHFSSKMLLTLRR